MSSTNGAPEAVESGKGRSRRVPMKECIGMGCIAAALVLVLTVVFTHAWDQPKSMFLVMIYTVVTLVAVSGISMFLNWIAAGETTKDPSKPVLD